MCPFRTFVPVARTETVADPPTGGERFVWFAGGFLIALHVVQVTHDVQPRRLLHTMEERGFR